MPIFGCESGKKRRKMFKNRFDLHIIIASINKFYGLCFFKKKKFLPKSNQTICLVRLKMLCFYNAQRISLDTHNSKELMQVYLFVLRCSLFACVEFECLEAI